ncbi:glucosylglycerol 3-phosphatase [Salinicola rhizosphaerae]|uniref:Glucosylglycerolphosphate phosphatase n=1 Tax=Salinicola rhizosphaerae TaxID=1443141 RepID=A0ABQ3DY47_9GAMM|nr:glucosylglycerol 3-phosphatase [Salinicola rhizosphaerae]GHB18689.1 glucosylglycerolphosphate phosphatase [Salinicola rhizosphaerae]
MTSTRSDSLTHYLDHAALLDELAATDNLLIIQDLDGVCMGLVGDPLTRTLERRYLDAARRLDGHFYVLTNGEHVGSRGVNGIVEALFETPDRAGEQGRYLPGLAAGGVQWQSRFGDVSHPGVSDAALDFLAELPARAERFLETLLAAPQYSLDSDLRRDLIASAVLDNLASPTLNINVFHRHWQDAPARYRQLQEDVAAFMQGELEAAASAGLKDTFFVHYAPNAGRDAEGRERLRASETVDGKLGGAGTTDFQFMLRGAVKEVGVLVILNRYYHRHTGHYPLGEAFNAIDAPRNHDALLALAREHFDPALMPKIVGVGDTVTSYLAATENGSERQRGGSDRGFLTLVKQLGQAFDSGNRALFVDSSGGEVRRPGVDAARLTDHARDASVDVWPALNGISDPEDPLRLDAIFPRGHTQYIDFFCELAARR